MRARSSAGWSAALTVMTGYPGAWYGGFDGTAALHAGDPTRVALEAYPGLLARQLIGRNSYKSDDKARQTPARRAAREQLLAQLLHHEPATAKTPMGDSPSVPGQPALPALQLTPALHQRNLRALYRQMLENKDNLESEE